MGYIFISYSHDDKEYVHRLHQLLFEHGLDAWIDDRLDYGSKWPFEIERRLKECSVFIVVMSSNSLRSHWVQNELELARKLEKPIYPLLLEGEPWWHVQTIQHIDVRNHKLPPPRFVVSVANLISLLNERDPGISINIGGSVQGNIIVGNDNTIRSDVFGSTEAMKDAVKSSGLNENKVREEQAEAARLVQEKVEADKKAKEKAEADRLAQEKAEADRLAREKAKAERKAKAKVEADRLAWEKAEAEKRAKEKAEADRLAREKAEADRLAREKVEADRLAREKAKRERVAPELLYNQGRGVMAALGTILAIFAIVMFLLGGLQSSGLFNFSVDQATVGVRFFFVVIGLCVPLAVYYVNKGKTVWIVGTRQVAWTAVGVFVYGVFSYLFSGTVFVVPSVNQVLLQPSIVIPLFFGYIFGPIVGLFTGAVGSLFGDALTGFGLAPQWNIGNGLAGFIAGLPMLFVQRKKIMDTVLWIGGTLALLATLLFFFNRNQSNMMFFDPSNNVFGDAAISTFAGMALLVGFMLVLIVRFVFRFNPDIAAVVTWGMLGNIVGIGFAAISDTWVLGFSLPAAIVGEFLPAAGSNLILAAILLPLLVAAYAAVSRRSSR